MVSANPRKTRRRKGPGEEDKWFTYGDDLFERDHLIEINKLALEMTIQRYDDKKQVAFLKRRLKKLEAGV